MQSNTILVIIWFVALVVLAVLMWWTSRSRNQETDESEDVVDVPVMPNYDHYWVRMDSSSNFTLDQEIEVIKADKKCHSVNDCIIEEHFPSPQVGGPDSDLESESRILDFARKQNRDKIKIFLVPLNKKVIGIGVFKHMDELGLRSGCIKELIALGKVFPEIHLKTVLAAFGSVWEQSGERRLVPYFEFNGATYDIYLDSDKKILANELDENWYAIAVSKEL